MHRRWLIVLGIGVIAGVLTLGSVITATRPEVGSPTPSATRTDEERQSSRLPPNGRCRFPRFRPTYLPWGPRPIPPPRRSYDHEIDRAQLLWINPDDLDDQVALTVYPLRGVGSPEKPIRVILDGSEGYLHEGSVGEHSAWWNLDARCNFLELSVAVDELSPHAMDDEVVKVARSLR